MRLRPYHGITEPSTTQQHTPANTKVSTGIVSCSQSIQKLQSVFKRIALVERTAHAKQSVSQTWVSVRVRGCQSVVIGPRETRLHAVKLKLLSACQSCPCSAVSVCTKREFFFPFTLTRASPRVDPPHPMSLFGPDKILENPSLAVNREIFSCNTSDVSRSWSAALCKNTWFIVSKVEMTLQ